jgi:hypothetical protein
MRRIASRLGPLELENGCQRVKASFALEPLRRMHAAPFFPTGRLTDD